MLTFFWFEFVKNMRRLWPHTENGKIKQSENAKPPNLPRVLKNTESPANKAERDAAKKTEEIDEKNAEEKTPGEANNSEEKISSSTETENVAVKENTESESSATRTKTGMCLINELVKMNKVRFSEINI
jgi:hypothetical protein